jgi:hypothetical protein
MEYDSGEVLPGLNEPWTFVGATLIEWSMGLVVFMMISLFSSSPSRAMPAMLLGWVCTTVTLATLRNSFPDEEKGVRNLFMTSCGFKPLGIPAPSLLQPVWSGAPVRELPDDATFKQLDLNEVFPYHQREFEDDEDAIA